MAASSVGYLLTTSGGVVFAFGAPFYGSGAGSPPGSAVVAIIAG
jgi:hypothetical protein